MRAVKQCHQSVVLIHLLLACVAASIAGASNVPLPAPIDVPSAPADIVAPGGAALPEFIGHASSDAPQISAISDMTFADETMIITGHGLEGSLIKVWFEGQLKDLRPDRTADDRMQACAPKDWPASTMLIWPVRAGVAGAPIRMNAATVWWCWPRQARTGGPGPGEILLFGKNLRFESSEPLVWLKGSTTGAKLEVVEGDLYHIAARLPASLPPGTYQLRAHNGTGGPMGWSEPVPIEITGHAPPASGRVFAVDDFGAKADDGKDDTAGIQKAVGEAIGAGGGTVRFSVGSYDVSQAIELPEGGGGVDLIGAGMGNYDATTHSVTGGTLMRSALDAPPPKCMLHIGRRFTSVKGMTLLCGHAGIVRAIHDRNAPSQVVVRLTGHNAELEKVRMVMPDLRPRVPAEERKDLQIFDAALHIIAPGPAHISVRDCEFHSAGSGIEIGALQRGHTDGGYPDLGTEYVRIEDCIFRGCSPGFYKEPTNPRAYGTMGIFNEGIQIPNGKRIIIRGCDFAGADRRGGKMIGRSICVYNTSVRELYIANNRSHDVGMVCPRQDRLVNQGEQILFHFRYPHGGYFDVMGAGQSDVTVDPADSRNSGKIASPHMASDRAGSRVLDEVGSNDHWILFVSAGKGVGQYRVVTGTIREPDRIVLKVSPGWRVVPDRASRVTLTTAFRRNIIANNAIDAGFIDPRCKVSGVLFWFNAFENIIAGNQLRNLGYGVGFNSSFRNPCGWNMSRGNLMENMGGMAVECSEPSFYFDTCRVAGGPSGPLFKPDSDVVGWYSVGNIARSNRGRAAACAAFLHAATTDQGSRGLPVEQRGGVLMPVLENNHFTGVGRGIVVNRGTVWPVLRGNTVQARDPATVPIFDQSASPRP